MPEQFTQTEFITSIREKYPQYNDIDDSTLVNSIVNKFPVYKDQISDFGQPIEAGVTTGVTGGLPKEVVEEEVGVTKQTVVQRALDITPEPEVLEPKEKGFAQRALDFLKDKFTFSPEQE